MTVNDKHYLLNRHNLTQPIQMQLSQKQKTFFQLFFAFSKSILNFKHLHRKDESPSRYIPGNAGSEKGGEINVWKAVFKKTLRQTIRQMGQDTVPI